MIARGSTFSGRCTSAAVIPINSMPPNENTTITNEVSRPCHPLGKKPPWAHKLLRFCGQGVLLEKSRYMPNIIMAIIALILITDMADSISPYMRTLIKLAVVITARQIKADNHCGMSGSQ